jgi:hypothetical protein
MDLRIRNRRAIVAGASVGLGYSAMALAREGVTLFICGLAPQSAFLTEPEQLLAVMDAALLGEPWT